MDNIATQTTIDDGTTQKLMMTHWQLKTLNIPLTQESTFFLRCDVQYSEANLFSGYEVISMSEIATHGKNNFVSTISLS